MLALEKQLKFELEKLQNNQILKSIFIGGGTPSSVDEKLYEPIFSILKNHIGTFTEITIEANPNSASTKWMQYLKKLGVNRISFGVQSFNNEKLKFLGRNHSKDQAIKAIDNASLIGFKNINCDIIYDTSFDSFKLIKEDLNIIKTLPINHISAYSLTIEEGTKFFKNPKVKIDNLKIANYIFSNLKQMGFIQYEISNFAKNNDAKSIHNYGYWQKEDYLGVGAGAVGYFKNKRYYPLKDIKKYIKTPTKYEKIETINDDENRFETIFLGLRSSVGVDIDIFNNRQKKNIQILIDEKKLIQKGNKIYNLDFLLTDEIVLFIN